jgi:hypothetical protein
MRWFHVFNLSGYISELEDRYVKQISSLAEKLAETRINISQQERDFNAIKTRLEQIETYFKNVPQQNDIEKEETPEVELNEEMRFPIVDGVKFKFEDEPGEGTPVKIY